MPKLTKDRVVMGKSAGFRPPDQAFCDAINGALQATGVTANDLYVEAIRVGLPTAVERLLRQRKVAEDLYLKHHLPGLKGKK